MARPREFEIEAALDRAMEVFWAKGYEGSSLQDLLQAMGIARGSLYKAFQDKRSIYLAALDRYDRTVVQAGVNLLTDPAMGDGANRVRRFLEAPYDAVALRKDRRGCFLCNAAVDRAPADPAIQAQVVAIMKRLERSIEQALKESRQARRWSTVRRARVASVILNAYTGLRVLARSGYPADDLTHIVEATLQNCRLSAARKI